MTSHTNNAYNGLSEALADYDGRDGRYYVLEGEVVGPTPYGLNVGRRRYWISDTPASLYGDIVLDGPVAEVDGIVTRAHGAWDNKDDAERHMEYLMSTV